MQQNNSGTKYPPPLVLQNFIIDYTSESAGAGIRAFSFNSYKHATVRTLEVPLVHESSNVIIYNRVRENSGKRVLGKQRN